MPAGLRRSFHIPEARRHFLRKKDFLTKHIKVDLGLDFDKKKISGSCTLTVLPIRTGVSTLLLDACGFEVRKVKVDTREAKWEYDGRTLAVRLPAELSRETSVAVEYDSVPSEGVYFTSPDPEHPEKEVQAWSHNEAEFARYWFPCFDHPNEKSSSELTMSVPKGFTVISNGKLISTADGPETSTFHWREELPHPSYLTSFVAGKLGVIEQEARGVKLRYYFPESKRPDVLRYFGETPKMIEVFEELTGTKYPYSKYDQTTVQDFIFGGMENFNATTLAMSYYPDAASEADFATTYGAPQTNAVNLVAHELAHQWFGDLVTCADWSHAWLNEAFATYFQSLYLEKTRGVDAFRWDVNARGEMYFEEDDEEYRRPVVDDTYVFPDDVFDYTLYEKGACMIHELRFVMGDEAFFKGIADYVKGYSFANADSHDLLRSLERSSGLSLEEFWEQAFHKPGYPEFELEYSWDENAKTATIGLKQVQGQEDGTPIFKLPCEFVFYLGDERVSRRVWVDSQRQTLTFGLDSKPKIVEFDPRRWLLKKTKFQKGFDLLLNQLAGSGDAWSRGEAAVALGKLKSDRALPGLKEAAAKEQFWDVRASALKAIGEIGSEDALKTLIEIGPIENRRVRRGFAAALGSFKDERARKILLQLLQRDESPYVRCEAALALAKVWPDGAFNDLKKAMEFQTSNDVLAEACLDAMGKLKAEGVKNVLLESIPYGKPTRVRIGALKILKNWGAVPEDLVQTLKDIILRDKEFRVRLFAITDVVRYLGDRRFIDAVSEASKTDKDPRVRRKALETYHELTAQGEASAAIRKLKSEVEELKDAASRTSKA